MCRGRILYLVPALRRGGAESLLVNVALELKRTAHWEPEVCTLTQGYELESVLKDAGIKVHSLGFRHRYELSRVRALAELTQGNSYDIIHSHLFPANLVIALNSKMLHPRFVMTEHSIWNKRRRLSALKMVDRFVYERFDRIVCVSKAVKAHLIQWIPELTDKVTELYNGIPTFADEEPCEKNIDLLCVGNLSRPAKGVDILLQAVKVLGDMVGTVCVAGDGRFLNDLERMRNRLGLQSRVRFWGSVDDVRHLMRRARVFVLPSRWEGLPIALLEAMEASLPVVATSVGGIPEVIRHGVNGVLVSPGDPGALAEGILSLLQDEGLARKLGWNARETVIKQFSLEAHTQQLTRLYEELLMN